jgi:hypothetical protein
VSLGRTGATTRSVPLPGLWHRGGTSHPRRKEAHMAMTRGAMAFGPLTDQQLREVDALRSC